MRRRWAPTLTLLLGLSLLAPLVQARAPVAAVEPAKTADAPQRELDAFARWVGSEKGELSALVVELETGRVVAAHEPSRALNPASTAKILTAAAALSRLGPERRFTSGVYGTVQDGVAARLVLRSDGDPSLSSKELRRWVRELVDGGLVEVGDVLVDQSHFDDRFVPPAFEQQPDEWAAFRAPVSAVALDKNSFSVRVEPSTSGKPPRVSVDPPGFVELKSDARTDARGKGRHLSVKLAAEKGRVEVKLGGRIGEDAPAVSFRKRVDDPRLYAGYVLRTLLERQGVAVTGAVREGGRDEKNALVERKSEPLRSLLAELGKHSDNFSAEMVLKALATETNGAPRSSSAGARAVSAWLTSVGAKEAGSVVVNGSGLFDANRASASTLVTALRAARRDPKIGDAFVEQLAVGGVDGTLKGRFRGKLVKRRVRAKTGTLARAHSLAGFWVAPDAKKSLAFAVLVNGIPGKAEEQRARIDRLVETAVRGR